MKKICILTHNDFDGGASAIVLANIYGKENVEVTSLGYKKLKTFVEVFMTQENYKRYQKTFVVDLSFSEEDFKICFGDKLPNGVFFIDHHDTSSHVLGKKNCYWNSEKSAASFIFDLFVEKYSDKISHLYDFITLAEDYDLWKKNDPKAEQINFLYFKYWGEKFINRFFDGNCNLTKSEQVFIAKKEAHIVKLKKNTEWLISYDNKLAYAVVPELHHMITEDIYEREPGIIGTMVFNNHHRIQSLGIKARPEYLDEHDLSVGAFCERYDGGGHRHVGAIGKLALDKIDIEKLIEEYAIFLGIDSGK